MPVSLSANRSKAQRDPSKWMPPNEDFHCDYLKMWVHLKAHWKLEMDKEEKEFIQNAQQECEH